MSSLARLTTVANVNVNSAQVTVIDLIARAGSTCTGFVSELDASDGPHRIEHTCEESFLKMMFPDHRAFRELEKVTQPLRTVVKRLGVAPLVPSRQAPFALTVPSGAAPTATALHDTLHHTIVYTCKHSLVVKDKNGHVVAEHCLRVVPQTVLPQMTTCEVESPAKDEEFVVRRKLWIFPRVDRLGSVLTNKAAAFSISVPDAANAIAGELLFINMTAMCGIRPRAIKLSIRRTMRCRLNPSATRAALPPFRKALIPPFTGDSALAPPIVGRSTAHRNEVPTRSHTLPRGATVPSTSASSPSSTSLQLPSLGSNSGAETHTRNASLPVAGSNSNRIEEAPRVTFIRGTRNRRRSSLEPEQSVEFLATVQRVIISKPFGHSFDGCFYIRVPQSCFSVSTDLVEVQHNLGVTLRFGMGRSLKKQVPVHIHQMSPTEEGPSHASSCPPGGWQEVFDIAGGRASTVGECPICFECMHGSRRASGQSRRHSQDSASASALEPSAAAAAPTAQPTEIEADTSEGSADCGCGSQIPPPGCSHVKPTPAAMRELQKENSIGKVSQAEAAATHGTRFASSDMHAMHVSQLQCSDGSVSLSTSEDDDSEDEEEGTGAARVGGSIGRAATVVVTAEAGAAGTAGPHGCMQAADEAPKRLPMCMSSPVPLVSLMNPDGGTRVSMGCAADSGSADFMAAGACCGSGEEAEGGPVVGRMGHCGGFVDAGLMAAAGGVPEWLRDDLAVTDCGHVFHSVCLLRHEHAAAARSGAAVPMPQCPVCRQEYRRFLGAMNCAYS